MWLISLKAEIREVSCVWAISRLSNNKQVVADVVRCVKTRNKVWLVFLQGKEQREMNAGCL